MHERAPWLHLTRAGLSGARACDQHHVQRLRYRRTQIRTVKCSLVAGDDAGLVVLAVVAARDETFALENLARVLLRLRARVRVYVSTTRQPLL